MTMLLPGMPVSYGMPYAMPGMMPGMMPGAYPGAMPWGGMVGAPVYISSLSQLPPGAVPASQAMLAQALGQANVGAQVVQDQPSRIGSILKGAGIGAAAGAAFGVIPFLPLGLVSGALVGAGIGAIMGLLKKPKVDPNEPHILTPEQQQAQAMAQMAASTPPGARSAASTAPVAARTKVVMGPEMRKRWAAKVRAERAEAAKAKADAAKK